MPEREGPSREDRRDAALIGAAINVNDPRDLNHVAGHIMLIRNEKAETIAELQRQVSVLQEHARQDQAAVMKAAKDMESIEPVVESARAIQLYLGEIARRGSVRWGEPDFPSKREVLEELSRFAVALGRFPEPRA